ncbi:MAG: sugar phosphate nucleotidyltransferase [Alphaproteobacteria bacterium]
MAQAAVAAAETRRLCLLAVPAAAPRAGLGYMQLGRGEGWREVVRFVEKPAAPAQLLAQGGDWAWNTGQFIAPAECFARLFRRHAPALWQIAGTSVDRAEPDRNGAWRLDATAYEKAPALSFDHAIAERTELIAIAPDIVWDDLGTVESWQAHNRIA